MYCKNCGFQMKDGDRFCTECGNNNFNIQNKFNDKTSVWLIILCILFPLVGFILYFSMKNTNPKAAKNYGISSLISFIVSFVICVAIVILTFIVFGVALNDFNETEWDETIEEDNFYESYEDDDLTYFTYAIDNYAKLANGKFYEDLYFDNTITDKCYNIDDLEESSYYDGSIQLRLVDGEGRITIWLTDFEHYVEAIDYDTFSIYDIKLGSNVEKSCSFGGTDNSL